MADALGNGGKTIQSKKIDRNGARDPAGRCEAASEGTREAAREIARSMTIT